MKLPGIKNLNWKSFLVDHGEKIVFGVVALLGLAALGMSRWAPYKKDPYDLIQQAKKAEADQKVSQWPEDKQQALVSDKNIADKARTLLTGLDEAPYVFGRTLNMMTWPVIPPKKQVEEPTWFPVRHLLADFGTGIFPKAAVFDDTLVAAADGSTQDAAGGAATEKTPKERTGLPRGRDLEDIKPAEPLGGADGMTGPTSGPAGAHGGSSAAQSGGGRGAGRDRGPAAGRGPGAAGRGPGAAGGGTGRGAARGPGGASRGPGRGPGQTSADPTAMMAQMYGGASGEPGAGYGSSGGPVEAISKRYVAVRGVFPIKDQEKALAEARGAQSTAEVAGLIDFTDFELQRQKALPGDDPWAGEWEKVDYQVANDVLDEVAQFAFDEVDPGVTNSVFTMPLPARVAGVWGRKGTHPALSQYELTDEFKKKHEWLQRKIAEYARQLEEQNKDVVKVGGFANVQYDAGQVGRMMMGDQNYMSSMMGEMGGMYGQPGRRGANGGQGMQLTQDEIKSMITASGTYLLFRYIDFDIQPGNAYRYRVRLQLRNPNLGLPADQVASPRVAEDPTRWTVWSEPSLPVVVPKDTRHYLVNIEPPRGREGERAWFQMFQWSSDTGTVVKEELPIEPGQFIAGTRKADVLDIAAGTYEPKEFEFTSTDMLVDIAREAGGLAAARPELGVKRNFQVPAQVLVVNDSGQLEIQDPVSDAPARTNEDEYIKARDEWYSQLKETEELASTDGYGMGEEGGGRGPGAANPLRRGRGRAAGSRGGPMGSPAMGAGYPPLGGSQGGMYGSPGGNRGSGSQSGRPGRRPPMGSQ
jgi:hypothetical protein